MNLTKTRKKAYFYLLLNAIIWGAALQVVKNSYLVTTPYRFLFYRYFIASIVIAPLIIKNFKLLKSGINKKKVFQIAGIEFIGTVVNLVLLYVGLSLTTSIEASLVAMTGPIFATLGGILILHEKEEENEIIGFLIALFATIIIVLEPVLIRKEGVSISLTGSFLILLQNIFNAVYLILTKRYYNNVSLKITSFISYILGMFSFLIISFVQLNGSIDLLITSIINDISSTSVLFASFYMAILGSILAMNFYLKGQRLIEVSEASLFVYLQPLVFIPLGVFWLKEPLSILQFGALILLLIGIIYASIRPHRYLKKRKS